MKINQLLALTPSEKNLEKLISFFGENNPDNLNYHRVFLHYLQIKYQLEMFESILAEAPDYYQKNKDSLDILSDSLIKIIINTALKVPQQELAYRFIDVRKNQLPIQEQYKAILNLIEFKKLTKQEYLSELTALINDEIPQDIKIFALGELIDIYLKQNNVAKAKPLIEKLAELDNQKSHIPYQLRLFYLSGDDIALKELANEYVNHEYWRLYALTYLICYYAKHHDGHNLGIIETELEQNFSKLTLEQKQLIFPTLLDFYTNINNQPSINYYKRLLDEVIDKDEPLAKPRKKAKPTSEPTVQIPVSKKSNLVEQIEHINELMLFYAKMQSCEPFREFLRLLFIKLAQLTNFEQATLLIREDFCLYWYKKERLYDKKVTLEKLDQTLIYQKIKDDKISFLDEDQLVGEIDINTNKPYDLEQKLFVIPLYHQGVLLIDFGLNAPELTQIYDILTTLQSIIYAKLQRDRDFSSIMDDNLFFAKLLDSDICAFKTYSKGKINLSDAAAKLLGLSKVLSDTQYLGLIHPSYVGNYQKIVELALNAKDQTVYEIVYQVNDKLVLEKLICLTNHHENILSSMLYDITEQTNKHQILAEKAIIDQQTKLNNLNALANDIDKYFEMRITFLLFKLPDMLKTIYPHQAINAYIKEFASFVKQQIEPLGIYRYNDFSLLVIVNGNDIRSITKLINNLYEKASIYQSKTLIDESFNFLVAGLRYPISTSEKNLDKIYSYLDLTLSKLMMQKSYLSNPYLFFNYELYQQDKYDQNIINMINKAINSQELSLEFRQVVNIKLKAIDHYESSLSYAALDIPNAYLYAVAQRRGITSLLDNYHLEQLIIYLAFLLKETGKLIKVSIPINKETFLEAGFVNRLISLQKQYQIPANFISIKLITNSYNFAEYYPKLIEIKKVGFLLETTDILSAMQFDFNFLHLSVNKNTYNFQLKTYCQLVPVFNNIQTRIILSNIDEQKQIDELFATNIELIISSIYRNIKPQTIIERIKGKKNES